MIIDSDKSEETKKESKTLWQKVKSFFKNLRSEASDKENPFLRKIKKLGYAVFDSVRREDQFFAAPFQFEEINQAYSNDSYVRQGLDKYIELMFKAGWEVVCKRQPVKEYMNKRFTMLADAMGMPIKQFFRYVAEDLVKYSNVFLVKKRVAPDKMSQTKGVSIQGLDGKKPVGAYFRLPPSTMEVKVDENGTIKKYRQKTSENEVEFNPEEIIHIKYKKPPGKFFGVPFMVAVIDDVKLLRQLEENVSKLVYRHLYPLFVYQVGLAEEGYESEKGEVQETQEKINEMPVDGGIVLPERHKIELLSAQSNINAEEYLDYFQKRVFTGLGVSETLMGRASTSNRSTAENQSAEMRDKAKALQVVMQDFINHFIIRELLMEGGFDPVLNTKDKAEFVFNEIDTDLKIKRENHAIYQFEHNAVTHEEMRQMLGRDPVEDESRLWGNMFDTTASEADTNNRSNPQNQHSAERILKREALLRQKIANNYSELRVALIEEFNRTDNEPHDEIVEESIDDFFSTVKPYLRYAGYKYYKKGGELAAEQIDDVVYKEVTKHNFSLFEGLINKLKSKLKKHIGRKKDIAQNLDDFEVAMMKELSQYLKHSQNLGVLMVAEQNDIEKVSYSLEGEHQNRSIVLENEANQEQVPQDLLITEVRKGGKKVA